MHICGLSEDGNVGAMYESGGGMEASGLLPDVGSDVHKVASTTMSSAKMTEIHTSSFQVRFLVNVTT